MTYLKPALALAAFAALAACEPTTTTTITAPGAEPVVVVDGPDMAPAAPTPTAGIDRADTMNGTWNLVASKCGDPASDSRLVINGTKFTFPTSECTATGSTAKGNATSVNLGCSGSANRVLDFTMRPGILRVTEDTTTLTYYRCM